MASRQKTNVAVVESEKSKDIYYEYDYVDECSYPTYAGTRKNEQANVESKATVCLRRYVA